MVQTQCFGGPIAFAGATEQVRQDGTFAPADPDATTLDEGARVVPDEGEIRGAAAAPFEWQGKPAGFPQGLHTGHPPVSR